MLSFFIFFNIRSDLEKKGLCENNKDISKDEIEKLYNILCSRGECEDAIRWAKFYKVPISEYVELLEILKNNTETEEAIRVARFYKIPISEYIMLLKILKNNTVIKKYCISIKKHCKTLLMKKSQKLYEDDYGNTKWDAYDLEVKYFIANVIYEDSDYKVTEEELVAFRWLDLLLLSKEFQNMTDTNYTQKIETGIDYENLVYNKLQDSGFEIQKTPTTGDQGVDLIASKNGERCAIQCKFYSSAVGNKAVQEVIAGKGYYSCEYAAVCSNNDFTKSARQLAHNQDIILASEENIADKLNELFSTPNSEKSTSNIKEEIESDFKDDVEENYIMENFIK